MLFAIAAMVACYIVVIKPKVVDVYGIKHYYAWIGLAGMVVVDLVLYLVVFRPLINLIFSD